ncbi:MAG: YccF domain-containing protein [Myxococcota bacterium]
MKLILNLLWAVFGGFVVAIQYLLGGLLLSLTVVGIPFGVQCFKLAGLALFPFGKDIEHDRSAAGGGLLGTVMNILWFVVGGLWIAISHLTLAAGLAVTIIGIPFAIQHLKLAVLAVVPFGKTVTTA